MMPDRIYWLLAERSPALPGEAGDFLSPGEQQKLSGMRFPKRRDDWLLGRWAAKSLVRGLPEYRDLSPAEIEVVNTPEGAPQVLLPGGETLPGCLSLSHSSGRALCALTRSPSLRLGVDLERVEPRPKVFVEDYFTRREVQLVDAFPLAERDAAVTLIWSMKEAMLKALGIGLRRDTRQVEVQAPGGDDSGGWQQALVREAGDENRPWTAWWQRRGDFILTVAAFSETSRQLVVFSFYEIGPSGM